MITLFIYYLMKNFSFTIVDYHVNMNYDRPVYELVPSLVL